MRDRAGTRVAVLGARGIGRHHAHWWRVEGAEVCAVLGRTPDSAAAAAADLRERWGIEAGAYHELTALLDAERPGVVDVCSPPEAHAAQAAAALEAGCDVLCEKPLVFDASRTVDRMRQEAAALADLAAGRGRRLALCSQYAVVAQEIRARIEARKGPVTVQSIEGRLASPARGRAPDPARTWMDLGPHLVAAAQTLAPGGAMAPASLRVQSAGHRVDVAFKLERPDGVPVACSLTVDHTDGEPAHVRRLALNGHAFDVHGEPGSDGHYGARYEGPGGSVRRADPMRQLIREFLAGRDMLGAAAALANQAVLLAVWERLRPGGAG